MVARGTQVSGDNILIVDGQFLAINEGNRLRRMVVGLGAGEATLDTQVEVYQMANGANQQIMEFNVVYAIHGSQEFAATKMLVT